MDCQRFKFFQHCICKKCTNPSYNDKIGYLWKYLQCDSYRNRRFSEDFDILILVFFQRSFWRVLDIHSWRTFLINNEGLFLMSSIQPYWLLTNLADEQFISIETCMVEDCKNCSVYTTYDTTEPRNDKRRWISPLTVYRPTSEPLLRLDYSAKFIWNHLE